MISCAFATVSHLQTLSCFPRVRILHTSKRFHGQLYVPVVNLLLCVAACLVTVSFKTTTIIGKAHGKSIHVKHKHIYKYETEETKNQL
jgi:KUP system potassium uptake protein